MRTGSDINILIVDDVSDNIKVAMNILKEENYNFSFATEGEQAVTLCLENHFDLILLDIMMPGIDGFETCKQIKSEGLCQETPVIFLTAKSDIDAVSKGFEIGGVDFISKPFHPNELLARVANHLELALTKEALIKTNQDLTTKAEAQKLRLISEIEENQREMIYTLMEMMESTSDETGQHIKRVAEYSKLFAHYTDYLNDEDAQLVFHAAPMHDIGKIAIPKEILHKPGKLTEEEFEVMKTHTIKGKEFLKNSQRKFLRAASIIAHQHHEKWDGSGYPQGLKGDQIHIFGRIVALADVFDALTHKRCYKDEWSMDDAVDYVKAQNGKQFDPALVEIFLAHLPEFVAIAEQK